MGGLATGEGMAEEEKNADRRRLIIEAGHVVILHPRGPAGGFPLVIPVDHVADGLHWFLGSCAPLTRGETLLVESPIQDDARYSTSATIAATSLATFALRISPLWQRVQQRAFVRISAHGLQVRVERLAHPAPPSPAEPARDGELATADPERDACHELLDVSAGGIRFQSSIEYEAGEDVMVHFELPGSQCFVIAGRVIRYPDMVRARGVAKSVAVAFSGIDESTRSQLLRWVYREQIRRHRQDQRQRT